VTITALLDSERNLIGFSKITRDLSELKAAQEAIERSDARFSGIVKISEDAIISMDEKQTITLFNDGAEKIFGYSSAEMIGQPISVLIPARFIGAHDGYIKNFGSSSDSLRAMNERGSIFGLRKDGTEFPAEASISKLEVAGEKVLTVRLRDITERKRAEEAARRSEARFAGIVRITSALVCGVLMAIVQHRNYTMEQNIDPRKRPLLTAEQLHVINRVPDRVKKGTPREEFEKLFRKPACPPMRG
jgi:PAS domain S-box-containing protein